MKTQTDFKVMNCFSLLLLYPLTKGAEEWIADNVWIDDWQDSGRIAIEPRYFDDIYQGILGAGLTIGGMMP